MHDIYPFVLPRRKGEQLWRQHFSENAAKIHEACGRMVLTTHDGVTGMHKLLHWYEVDVVVQSPIRAEFCVYDAQRSGQFQVRGDLIAEISHSYGDTTLYPHIAEEQRREAARVLAERERLAAARLLEEKLAAIHLELFGEPICVPTDSID